LHVCLEHRGIFGATFYRGFGRHGFSCQFFARFDVRFLSLFFYVFFLTLLWLHLVVGFTVSAPFSVVGQTTRNAAIYIYLATFRAFLLGMAV
jgi:hypothetical protein